MQPVNDDMDHLFRQAANNYPLNTQGADFDKLQQRMQTDEEATPTQKKGRKQRFAWLLLLLIAVPFICEHQVNKADEEKKQLAAHNTNTSSKLTTQSLPGKEKTATNADSNRTDLSNRNSTSSIEKNKTTTAPTQSIPEDVASKNNKSINKDQSHTNGNNTGSSLPLNSKKSTTQEAYSNTSQLVAIQKKKNRNGNKLSSLENTIPAKDVAVLKSGQKAPLRSSPTATVTGQSSQTIGADITNKVITADSTHTTQQQPDTATAIVKNIPVKDSSTKEITTQKKQQKEQETQNSYLYAGIVAGIDFSVVKSTRTGGTGSGYNAGFIAGYHFSKHWAVETGLLWSHKNYYADGKYVSVEYLQLLPHTQVSHMNGYCGMYEIPLNAQYHFSNKSKGHWYVGAGLSSYIMKEEEYYYSYKRYNMDYYGKKDYSNSTKNWFSVLQLKGGYQLKTGNKSILRVEPYVKLPLSGIGIAKLPLSSTGLNIGYMMSF